MALFFNLLIAVVVFVGVWLLIGLLAGIAGFSVFIAILRLALIVGAVIWLIRFISGLVV